jgi:hypothetical protein
LDQYRGPKCLYAPQRFHLSEKAAFLLATRIALIIMDEIGKKRSTADKVIARALQKNNARPRGI